VTHLSHVLFIGYVHRDTLHFPESQIQNEEFIFLPFMSLEEADVTFREKSCFISVMSFAGKEEGNAVNIQMKLVNST
jgi:hypothetical protein